MNAPCTCTCKCATVPDWAKDQRRWCGCCLGSCPACIHGEASEVR